MEKKNRPPRKKTKKKTKTNKMTTKAKTKKKKRRKGEKCCLTNGLLLTVLPWLSGEVYGLVSHS